jgi:hypothetical protein
MMKKTVWVINQESTIPKYAYVHHRHFYLGKEWARNGYDVNIFSSNFNHFFHMLPPNDNILNYEEIEGVNYYWLRSNKYKSAGSIGRIWSWLQYFILLFYVNFKIKKKPDVVIVSSTAVIPVIYGVFLKYFYKSKFIYEVRDLWPRTLIEIGSYSKYNPLIIIMTFIERLAYSKSDVIVGTMPNLPVHIDKIIPGKTYSFKCIPQGVDLELYSGQYHNSNFDQYFNNNDFFIGYAGTIGTSNELDILMSAAEYFQNNNLSDIKILILGGGAEKINLIKKTSSLKNVFFLDPVKKQYVSDFLKRCSVLYDGVKPVALYEAGLSRNKWVDYMMSARPIVVSYTGYLSLLNEANCGVAVNAGDKDALIKAILDYKSLSSEELNTIGLRGKEYIVSNRQFSSLAKAYSDLF